MGKSFNRENPPRTRSFGGSRTERNKINVAQKRSLSGRPSGARPSDRGERALSHGDKSRKNTGIILNGTKLRCVNGKNRLMERTLAPFSHGIWSAKGSSSIGGKNSAGLKQ